MEARTNHLANSTRLESLDQFRGYTVAGMYLVNFLGAYTLVTSWLPNLKHHNTFCSYADTIMPQFFFAVGFGFRLTLLKRFQSATYSQAYQRVTRRILGLLLVALVFHGLSGSYESWEKLQQAGWWQVLEGAFYRNFFQTLTHIAFASLWVAPVIACSWQVRLSYLIFSAILHVILSANFYYDWVMAVRGIDGGPLGFLSWSIVVLCGSFAYDILSKHSFSSLQNEEQPHSAPAIKMHELMVLRQLVTYGLGLMALGYFVSCINQITPPNTTKTLSTWKDLLVEPPFVPPTDAVNMWTMSQRAGSVSYMIFSSGFCFLVFALFYALADVLRIRLGVLRTLGVNALAAYILHDLVNNTLKPFCPKDSPAWYAFLFFGLSFTICYLFLRNFEKQKIYFRL